jgi:hypothetical protein
MCITLSFDEETEEYVRLMCTRKGYSLENYILDNFEWDDKPECISDNSGPNRAFCVDCEYNEKCLDVVLP